MDANKPEGWGRQPGGRTFDFEDLIRCLFASILASIRGKEPRVGMFSGLMRTANVRVHSTLLGRFLAHLFGMRPQTNKHCIGALVFFWAAVSVTLGQAPKPLLEYHFDETGNLCVSVGSNMLPLTLLDVNGTPADLHSADASGISTRIGDRAFDNTSATAMGGAGKGGVALVPTNIVTMETFSSFTLQCWFNSSVPLSTAARLFDTGNYVVHAGRKPGVVWLTVNHLHAGTPPVYVQTNAWVFFAVSYDGTRESNNVVFYQGTKNSPVVRVGSAVTLNAGRVANSHAIGLGNHRSANTRPLLGLLDDVRIFGVESGDAGVLTQAQLESLRQSDSERLYSSIDTAVSKSSSPGKAPVISNPKHAGAGFSLDVQTISSANYSVLWSTNLTDWQTLTNFVGDGNVITVLDPNDQQRAFYRVLAH